MNATELANLCRKERKPTSPWPGNLRTDCYREHYPIIREAVEKHGAPLLTAIKVFRREKKKETGEDPFGDRSEKVVWDAYARVFKKEGIKLTGRGE